MPDSGHSRGRWPTPPRALVQVTGALQFGWGGRPQSQSHVPCLNAGPYGSRAAVVDENYEIRGIEKIARGVRQQAHQHLHSAAFNVNIRLGDIPTRELIAESIASCRKNDSLLESFRVLKSTCFRGRRRRRHGAQKQEKQGEVGKVSKETHGGCAHKTKIDRSSCQRHFPSAQCPLWVGSGHRGHAGKRT